MEVGQLQSEVLLHLLCLPKALFVGFLHGKAGRE